jgi:hypothetical protein
MRKFILNLALGEPLSLVQELPCFDNLIKLDPLLESALDLSIHDMINRCVGPRPRFEEALVVFDHFWDFDRLVEDEEHRRSGDRGISPIFVGFLGF